MLASDSPIERGLGLRYMLARTSEPPRLLLDALNYAWRPALGKEGRARPERIGPARVEKLEIRPGVTGEWAENTQSSFPGEIVSIGNLLWQEKGVQHLLSGPYGRDELLRAARSLQQEP